MDSITKYLKEVRSELKKVEWPKRNEVLKLTLTVCLITGIVGAYVAGLDYAFANLVEYLVQL